MHEAVLGHDMAQCSMQRPCPGMLTPRSRHAMPADADAIPVTGMAPRLSLIHAMPMQPHATVMAP